jgi:hypothetical protein
VEILLYDISKGMAAKLGPLLLGKSAEVRMLRGVWPAVMKPHWYPDFYILKMNRSRYLDRK